MLPNGGDGTATRVEWPMSQTGLSQDARATRILYGIDGPWWALVVGGLMLLFGLFWIYATARAFVAQVRNPEV